MREQYNTYLVFWTYAGNYADKVRKVRAHSVVGAIEETWYGTSKNAKASKIRWIVFKEGAGLVLDGPKPGGV